MKTFKSDYVTVYNDKSEVIVFGEGSDWIVRFARATNFRDNWRKWFGKRELAEQFAEELSRKDYSGRFPKIV